MPSVDIDIKIRANDNVLRIVAGIIRREGYFRAVLI
jgi:hypothetical protein